MNYYFLFVLGHLPIPKKYWRSSVIYPATKDDQSRKLRVSKRILETPEVQPMGAIKMYYKTKPKYYVEDDGFHSGKGSNDYEYNNDESFGVGPNSKNKIKKFTTGWKQGLGDEASRLGGVWTSHNDDWDSQKHGKRGLRMDDSSGFGNLKTNKVSKNFMNQKGSNDGKWHFIHGGRIGKNGNNQHTMEGHLPKSFIKFGHTQKDFPEMIHQGMVPY